MYSPPQRSIPYFFCCSPFCLLLIIVFIFVSFTYTQYSTVYSSLYNLWLSVIGDEIFIPFDFALIELHLILWLDRTKRENKINKRQNKKQPGKNRPTSHHTVRCGCLCIRFAFAYVAFLFASFCFNPNRWNKIYHVYEKSKRMNKKRGELEHKHTITIIL